MNYPQTPLYDLIKVMNPRLRFIRLRPERSGRTRLIISFFLAAFLATACQSTKTANTDLTSQTLTNIGFADWIVVSELESQALLYLDQEPLKLGSIGSAILEKDPSNLIGRLALSKFYSSLGTIETGTDFTESYEESLKVISESGNGSPEKPWVVSSNQAAELFLKDTGISRVGGVYQSNLQQKLGLMIIGLEGENTQPKEYYFDLSHLLNSANAYLSTDKTQDSDNPWPLLRLLSESRDSAAQAAIGAYLVKQKNYKAAINWLTASAQQDNLFAHTLLARIFWSQFSGIEQMLRSDKDQSTLTAENRESLRSQLNDLKTKSQSHHRQAISLGSVESMYTLGRLLFEGKFGPGKVIEGQELLEQSGKLGNAESFLFLAHHYRSGSIVQQDISRSTTFFSEAAKLRNPEAIVAFARFLMSPAGEGFREEEKFGIVKLLEELVAEKDPEAMVVLGNLSAAGVQTDQSFRQAISWYRKAVKAASNNIDEASDEIINEVAWILATTSKKSLKRARYALRIIDKRMQDSSLAREKPEFLDTWAAALAANGQFEKAIEIQNRAISKATEQDRDDVLQILEKHLKSFKLNQPITE
mgnify:FL=1